MSAATFSEHWHRVANQRVALRPAVEMRKQFFRGERWYLVIDPLNNQFFRISPSAHDFLCRLSSEKPVQQVWDECLERDPDGAPGQEEVIQLLGQLYQANLLRGEVPPESANLFQRYKKRRQREVRSFLNLLSFRIPLLDPDRFLRKALPAVRWLMSPLGALLWLGVVGAAIKVAIDNAALLKEQSESVLAPGNLPLLYAGLVLIKALHEFGHAFACRRFGGEVHEMGVMFIYLSPVPYVDATSSWAFRNGWRRIFVASAGMIVELFVAALATFVWANTGAGALHSLAYNMMFIASVTTLFFNANPLMKYDGYYILSDLLEMPNLQQRSMQVLQYLIERFAFGCRKLENPARSNGETAFLALFGAASWVYRVILLISIALFVSGKLLIVGVLMALGCVYAFTIKPVWQLVAYLATSPRIARTRHRAIALTASAAAVIIAFLAFWPMPSRFRAPGVLRAEEYSEIFTSTPGVVAEIHAGSGERVEKGQSLLRLASPELELEIAAAQAAVAQALAEEERALARAAEELAPLRSRRAVAEKRLGRLRQQQRTLVLTAPHAGTWVSPRIEDKVGRWFPRGERVGQVVQDEGFRFSAVISQEEAANVFTGNLQRSEVRIAGQAGESLGVQNVRVIPAQQEILPSAALGWAAGGEVATSHKDPTGARAAEPFFELRALVDSSAAVTLLHGRSGKIRLELREEPLLQQWYRRTRQLLQKKYAI